MTEKRRGAPNKKALNYFPKMCNFYEDDKIFELLEKYGTVGVTVYDCILTIVYSQGYYADLSKDKLSKMVVHKIGTRWVKQRVVVQVIQFCAELGLLHKTLLDQSVVTSVGIQTRYYEIAIGQLKRRLYSKKYWLLDENGNEIPQPLLNAPKNRINSEENRINSEEKGFNSELNRFNSVERKGIERNRKEVVGDELIRNKSEEILFADKSFSDKDFARVVSEFEHSGFMLSGRARDELIDMIETYGASWTIEAIHRAADRGKKSIAYIRGILNNWQQKGAIDDEYSHSGPDSNHSGKFRTPDEGTDLDKKYML